MNTAARKSGGDEQHRDQQLGSVPTARFCPSDVSLTGALEFSFLMGSVGWITCRRRSQIGLDLPALAHMPGCPTVPNRWATDSVFSESPSIWVAVSAPGPVLDPLQYARLLGIFGLRIRSTK